MITEGSSENMNIRTTIFLFPNNALKRTALVVTGRNILTGMIPFSIHLEHTLL